MHVIIPTAGFGARLRPHTYSRPKVLLNVAGKPILAHILDSLISGGTTSATIVIGYLGASIEQFVRETYPNLPVNFVEQPELLGLGHSIWVARESFPTDGSPLFIMLGDTIMDIDFAHAFALPTSAIGVQEVPDPRRFGVVEVTNGVITKLIEKPENPTSNLAIAGLYLFRNPALLRSCLDELVEKNIRTKNEYQLTDALQLMIDRGEKFSIFEVGAWYDCGKPETLLETNRHLLDKYSHPNVRTFDRTVIVEPCMISETAEIENSVIGPHATIGSGAQIRNALVRDSIIGDGAAVDSVIVEGSLVGNAAVVRGSFRHINVGDSSEVIDQSPN